MNIMDEIKKKKSKWTPGAPGRPPAWASEQVKQLKNEKKDHPKSNKIVTKVAT